MKRRCPHFLRMLDGERRCVREEGHPIPHESCKFGLLAQWNDRGETVVKGAPLADRR